MREIKFRAWIDGEYLVYSDMSKTYPYDEDEILWGIQGGLEVSTFETLHRISGGDVDEYESFTLRGGEGDEVVFMQYTGLKDENGAEVYSGDILKAGDDRFYAVVEFDDREFMFSARLYQNGYKILSMGLTRFMRSRELAVNGKIKIIGNIHENPELLEKNND